jgi:lysophospholipase L1-like esterase
MTERQLKRFSKLTRYDREKQKKKDNYSYLNKTVCKKGQVVLVGDSITELFNMELLDGYREKTNTIIYNRGISGDTSNRLLERFNDNVLKIEPRLIILLIGINDLSRFATPQYINDNVVKMLNMIKEQPYEIKVVLQAVYPINATISPHLKKIKSQSIFELNSLLKNTANTYSAEFIDLTNQLSDDKGLFNKSFTYDGLHPNAQGFEVVANNLLKLKNLGN